MVLNLNINDITQPVIKEVNRSSFVRRFIIKSLEGLLERIVSNLNNTLNNSILMIEGTHNHLKELSPESADKMLFEIKEVIIALEKQYERLEKSNFLDSDELKSKYKYLLKSIYKSEAITHKIAFRGKKTLKTDESIKDGIINMNSYLFKKSV